MTYFPIFIVGLSDVIGSWNIIEISLPRNLINSFHFFSQDLLPKVYFSSLIRPESPWKSLVIALVVTDLPEPDSPTIAKVSPLLR